MQIFEKIIKKTRKHYIITLVILYIGILIIWKSISLTLWGWAFQGLIISFIILIVAKFIGYINTFGFRKNNILKGLDSCYPVFCVGIYSLILSLVYINRIGFLKPYIAFRMYYHNHPLIQSLLNIGVLKPYYYFIGIYIIHLFGVALFEEIFMRGIILNILVKNYEKNKLFPIIISSFIFGITHLLNGFEYLVGTISQVLYTTVLGIFWAVIYLKYNNIWCVVISHFLLNCMIFIPFLFFSFIENTFKLLSIPIVAVFNVLISIPGLIYSLHLYKNIDKKA